MADEKVLVTKRYLTNIANAIRAKGGTVETMLPSEMSDGIDLINALPNGFSKIATGSVTLDADTNADWTVGHNLGAVPDLFLIYRSNGNVEQTYSVLWALRCPAMAYRASTYLNYTGYHGTSTTTVSVNNGTTRCIKSLTATTATITYYSNTSYYWRAGGYKWLAIKFN